MKNPAIPEPAQIAAVLEQHFAPFTTMVYEKLARYMALLYRWNSRMNLTAVRDPEVLLRIHLPECLLCGLKIPATAQTMLDFGSGAGLPGIPVQIIRPDLSVTLGESQGKKAAFLREAQRELDLTNSTVFANRIESLPSGQQFDVVTLRAVDQMQQALQAAEPRIASHGACMVLTSENEMPSVEKTLPAFSWNMERVTGTRQRILLTGIRQA